MLKLLLSVSAFLLSITVADAWDLTSMNNTIDNTNVIVGGICSGTVVDTEKRYVLTAHHCVTDQYVDEDKEFVDDKTGEVTHKTIRKRIPTFIEVWHKNEKAEIISDVKYEVTIKGDDSTHDVVILQVTDPAWKPNMAAKLSTTEKYVRGERVYAVGNPAIAYDMSITEGIISNSLRQIEVQDMYGKLEVFQHSASIIGGNSGGAIYNDQGEVIGTVSAGLRGANIGFAVPIHYSIELIKRLDILVYNSYYPYHY